ncbi:hypothetical protein ACVIGA_006419 [Bradyrhizobium sp. USDA 3240]
MLRVDIVDAELDEGQPAVLRLIARHQRPHPGPGAVGADHEIERPFACTVEDEIVLAVIAQRDLAQAAAPGYGIRRQRLQQQVAQRRTVDLRTVAGHIVIPEQQPAIAGVEPAALIFVTCDAQEAVGEPGARQRELAALGVQVERSALRPLGCRAFAFEQAGLDPGNMQQASERQAAGAGADDSNANGI